MSRDNVVSIRMSEDTLKALDEYVSTHSEITRSSLVNTAVKEYIKAAKAMPYMVSQVEELRELMNELNEKVNGKL